MGITKYPVLKPGAVYGRWTILSFSHRNARGKDYWACLCVCGVETAVNGQAIRSGVSISCGCYSAERRLIVNTKHGMVGTPTYHSWSSMISRCGCPNRNSFKGYGARGIKVCERWVKSFEAFLADMGEKPIGMSIERINNDGNYEPSNCRWATRKEQMRNTRVTRKIPYGGRYVSGTELAEITGCVYPTLMGWFNRYGEARALENVARFISQKQEPLPD